MLSATARPDPLTAGAGAGADSEYSRTLSSSALDQAAFDAETYGEKAGPQARSRRAADDPGPRAGGNRLEDAAANPIRRRLHHLGDRGHQDPSQARPGRRRRHRVWRSRFRTSTSPTRRLLRMREPKGPEVYRFIDKSAINAAQQQQQQMQMQMQQGFSGALESRRRLHARRSRPRATRFVCRSSARGRSFASR